MMTRLLGATSMLLTLAVQAHPGHDIMGAWPLHTAQHGSEHLLLLLGTLAITAMVIYRVRKR